MHVASSPGFPWKEVDIQNSSMVQLLWSMYVALSLWLCVSYEDKGHLYSSACCVVLILRVDLMAYAIPVNVALLYPSIAYKS